MNKIGVDQYKWSSIVKIIMLIRELQASETIYSFHFFLLKMRLSIVE